MRNLYFKPAMMFVLVFCIVFWTSKLSAQAPDKTRREQPQMMAKPSGEPLYQILNINNLWTWARADGHSNHSPSGNDGVFFPRGTAFVIYQDGVMFGGKAYLDQALTQPAPVQTIRVGGATYNVGTRAGRVIGEGANAVAANPADADVRIYRIRRDYRAMTEGELTRDASESFEKPIGSVTAGDINRIIDQYHKDWEEWPVQYGAPYIERNGVPGYQPPPPFSEDFTVDDLILGNYDEPGIAGADPTSPADQVIWTVFNDLDRTATLGLFGSEPLGLEIQATIWGYKRTDAMGNLYFKRMRIINKGGVDIGGGQKGSFYIDSMYVSQFSDPDVGAFGDDLAGCDTVLSLGFAYNGNPIDSEFRKFNLPPPAVGYDFLQGPIVPSPGDSAIFNFHRVYDAMNLGLTSFAYFSAGSGISDPPFTYEGGLRWYRMFQGFVPDPSTAAMRLYPHPPGMELTKFPLSGDPVSRTGFIDGLGTQYSFVPGDRRIVLNSGPFVMAPGDTQEVVIGTVAGLGSDRLSSIAVMKFNDRFVQNTYDALFQVPRAPAAPRLQVTEIDGAIIMNWGGDLAALRDTEDRVNEPGGYAFEGYNVYQFPSRGASLAEATRIATFDLPTDPTVILDEQFDPASGQILQLPVQFGTNSGIIRYFKFDRDYIRDIDKLYNGQEYYIAVTAYSRATDEGFLPAALESAPEIFAVRPQIPYGKQFAVSHGDTLPVAHLSGRSDGVIRPIVVDPGASSGKTYEVRFAIDDGETTWSLVNVTDNRAVVSGLTNFSGDDNYDILEGGILLKVEGPPPGLKQLDQFDTADESQWGWKVTSGGRRFTWANADGLGFEGFRGAAGWASPAYYFGFIDEEPIPATELKAVEVRLANAAPDGTFDPNQPNVSYGYRYGRGFGAAPAKPEFAPYIINTDGVYPYQDFTKSVPLAVYDIDSDPPRRLAVGHLENNGADGMVDGKYWPGLHTEANNVAASGPREWLFVFDADYSETPNSEFEVDVIANPLPIMYFIAWNRHGSFPTWFDNDALALYPTRPNTPNDVFQYTLPAAVAGPDEERFSAEKVNVFPNPYYAFNPAETNRFVRFVTFSHLPPKAMIRIFNLAGQLVRTIEKDDNSQFLQWDLNNQFNFPVASGMYLAHIEMTLPTDGSTVTKILKLAIIQEQEVLDVF
jgi:hypothetical protein